MEAGDEDKAVEEKSRNGMLVWAREFDSLNVEGKGLWRREDWMDFLGLLMVL